MSTSNLVQVLNGLNCQYAFYFALNGEPPLQKANAQRFPAASIIKVPILLAWVHLERSGQVDRSEICNLDAEAQVQGAGFSWLLTARRLPYHDVLLMMIALSDNLCTNLVIRHIGIERLNRVFRDELLLTGTELQRKLMDYEARERGLDNWITLADCIRYFDLVDALDPEEKGWVEPLLLANQDSALLMRDIPRDTLDFYHKTGSMSGVLHDWGYTRAARICLLTQGVTDETVAFQIFGTLGRLLIDA